MITTFPNVYTCVREQLFETEMSMKTILILTVM